MTRFDRLGYLVLLHCLCFLIVLYSPRSNRLLAQQSDDFPAIYNSAKEDAFTPMPARQAVASMQLPEGFVATVFAAEPEVQNPIAVALDSKERVWIAENYTYSDLTQRFDLSLRDRVVVLEDRDGDGQADSRKVFCDNVQMLTSVEVGRGGVWLMCPPRLLFIPDADEDAVADGPARVVLDGFDVAKDNYHNFANGLRFGPDGWLYGRCGHSCPGKIGLPGTPDDRRVPLDGGIWRYHPVKHTVEVLCHGTTNPWGHDWDKNGELFFINTVIGHLWHMIPGCHLKESFGESLNPRVYQRMDMIADHYHFDRNGSWMESRDGKANDLGGGHAHIGAMIYQGTRWPERFHNRLLTWNMHGRRANVERLESSGSGFVGKHEPDVFLMSDPFFRGLDLLQMSDGNCLVIDWSDTGECHEHDGVHRRSGRVYKISYNDPVQTDATRVTSSQAVVKPWCMAGNGPLPKLWRDYQEGLVSQERLLSLLQDPDEAMRVWAIRLLTDHWPLDWIQGPSPYAVYPEVQASIDQLIAQARHDPSGLVRRQLASTLQRIPVARRVELALALASRAEDAEDLDLNLLVWFGLSPVGEVSPESLLVVVRQSPWKELCTSIARFLASRHKDSVRELDKLFEIALTLAPEQHESILTGVAAGLFGQRKLAKPSNWLAFAEQCNQQSGLQEKVRQLNVIFGDGLALEQIRQMALDANATNRDRQIALQTLIDARPSDLRSTCEILLDTRVVNATAAKGLAQFNDPNIAALLVRKYRRFQPDDRLLVLEILCSRPAFAKVMLDSMVEGKSPIRVEDIHATHARQIQDFGDPRLQQLLVSVWGTIQKSSEEKTESIRRWREVLTPQKLSEADLKSGRALFDKNCAQCHRLFGSGQDIGPDITGAQRGSLDYLLANIIDPGAVVGKDYRMSLVLLADGRTVSGLITSRDDRQVKVRTAADLLVLESSQIESIRQLDVSAMPEGLLNNLNENQVRDLMAYLSSPVQVE